MKNKFLKPISSSLAILFILVVTQFVSPQEKDKEKKKTQGKNISVSGKEGKIRKPTKYPDLEEELQLDLNRIIDLKIEILEIKPTQTILIASPTIRTENGATVRFLAGRNKESSLQIDITPSIEEGKGIKLKIGSKIGDMMTENKIETLLTRNLESALIEMLKNKSDNSKLAIKITPFVVAIEPAKEYPKPVYELQLNDFVLLMNNDRLIAKGSLQTKSEQGEFILYFYVEGKGIYVLSFKPFEGAKKEGVANGKVIKIKHGEDYFEWICQDPILAEGKWLVWVRNNPTFKPSPVEKTQVLVLETINGYAGIAPRKDYWKKFF